ncbi:MAG: hypothetical protein KF847_11460 [Pirellulales bacterium]|nr:hypothetical protein [Pirellulales bacterium]
MKPRLAIAVAVLPLALAPAASHARLFLQTYGATSAADGGCVWNANQDYFVPRHCDSCRYDLWSTCKSSLTSSAACRNIHPLYDGYCSPYGACRYRWRDHVYKSHCGCSPLQLQKGQGCLKHGCRHGGCGRDCDHAGPWDQGHGCLTARWTEGCQDCPACELPNVEPAGGIVLGQMPATSFASSFMGMAGGGQMSGLAPFGGGGGMAPAPGMPAGVSLPALPAPQVQPLPTTLPGYGF